jgi:ABC-2 type transport system ATP-binding protein
VDHAGATGPEIWSAVSVATGTIEVVTPAVEVVDLVKRYPKSRSNAVDGVSFTVAPGEIFGFLGPNGAGKSTTIGILTSRVLATSGTARVSGVDVLAEPVRARSALAVVPQRVNLDRQLTARQNLLFHAHYHGIGKADRERRADELLEQFGLGDRGSDKVDRYSGGQAQRLMIARALMHRPSVLFLDEPSTGLDPQARLFVWDRIRELREVGVTVMLTTHDMDEASELCDRVGIIDHGRLLALDTPAALTRTLPGSAYVDVGFDGPAPELGGLPGVSRAEQSDGRVRLYVDGEPARLIAPLASAAATSGRQVVDLSVGAASLEDVFISLTGRGLR